MANEILTEKRGQSLIVTFNRTDRGNALNLPMANQLLTAVKPITTDAGIRAVMLRGQGGHFMDGLDLDIYRGDFNAGLANAHQLTLAYHSTIREMHIMDKPVVAAVTGSVAGPGLSLMLACDLVIAARSARFSTGFVTYGMSPDGGMSFHLTRKAGAGRAAELLMFGDSFTAEQAQAWGLVNKVVEDEAMESESAALLDRLTQGPTRALGGIKRVIAKAFEQDLIAQLSFEHTHTGACSRSFDFRDAIKAHEAKRPPKFTGA